MAPPPVTTNPLLTGLMTLLISSGFAILPILIMEFSIFEEVADRLNFVANEETYDFVVVGAGSSGNVVASRLSENFRVLLIEAGGEPFPLQNVPAMAPLMLKNPTLDWIYSTVPQKYSCLSLNDQISYWPRGKGLGGTSNLNFMVWVRGHPFDYDHWAYQVDDDRWNYDNLVPYFKRSESYHGVGEKNFHGFSGEINLEPASWNPLVKPFLSAAEEMGYSKIDLNAPYQEGFNEFVFNAKRGQRMSSYNAFIRPIRHTRRDRLTIRKYALVTKVLFKGSNNLAYGVEYERGGLRYIAKVNKEVVLSAGTVGSPKILMQSGIGSVQHLQSVGIEPRVDLPGVGQNLQDHVVALVGPFVLDSSPDKRDPITYLTSRDSGPSDLLQYMTAGTGPMSQAGVMATGFVNSNNSLLLGKINGVHWPDLQLILLGIPIDVGGPEILAKLYNLKSDVAKEFYGPIVGQDSFHIMAVASRPKSRGSVLLSKSDPKAPPLIDPNYLENPDDVSLTLEGIKKALHMVENTEAFKKFNGRLSPTPFPACKEFTFRSDEYWECYLRHYTLSVYHPAGTCAMGRPEDTKSVLDSKLRVRGTERLRVIDASIMPQITSCNIQAACTVIGELGSEFIKETWKM